MSAVRLSLVVPAYNEAAGIRRAVAEADDALARLGHAYEILVVDDGSSDGTAEAVLDEARSRPHVRLLRHERNRGYGAALRTGFEAAAGGQIAFTDADCQFHLDDLAPLLAADAPVAVGYRIDRKDVWRRRFLSRGYNLLARTLLGTGVRDVDCALKVFRRDALIRLMPQTDGFFVNTEMLTRARQLGLAVAEVGVRHRPRLAGQSSVSMREVPKVLGRLLPFWWSKATFAGGYVPEERSPRWPALLVLLLACLLFFARLRAPLLEPQEARYAEIPRQMLAEGRLVVPVLHGQDYLDKPPLLYWAVMASYRAFGVGDWSARLVPGLAGVLTAMVTYFWGRRVLGGRAGLCAACVLCLTPEFVYRGRMLGFDVLLMLWVTASLAAAHVALLSGLRWRWWLLSAAACGLGVLTKGPVAFALVVPPLVAVAWLDRRLARITWRRWLAFAGVALLVAAPWYVAASVARPGFAGDFFWRHNVERFVTPFDHAKPVWYYLPGLAAGLMPWALLLPVLGAMLASRSLRSAQGRPGALGLALAASVWVVAFFSAAGCKRPSYLLPALPPLALALGWVVASRVPSWRALLTAGSRLAAGVAALALVMGTAAALTAALVQAVRPADGFAMAGVSLSLLALLGAARRLPWAAAGAAAFAVMFVGVRELLPAYNERFAVRGQLRRQAGGAKAARRVVCYPMRYDSVGFYLPEAEVTTFGYGQRRELIAHLEANPEVLVVIKSGPTYADVVRDLPPGLRVRTMKRQGAVVVGRVVSDETRYARRGGER